uniref:Uncharacterized protein n=1 Tax=Ciona savignyi TaxID=51511 RepID=H2ZGC8_CIOSA
MNQWLERHGKRASEMNVDEMRRMQTVYMQQLHHWSQQQQKAYMQWYWQQQQNFQQHRLQQQKPPFYNNQPPTSAEQKPATDHQHGPDQTRPNQPQNHLVSSMPQGVRLPLDQHPHSMGSMPQRPQDPSMATFTRAPSQLNPPNLPNNQMEGTTHVQPQQGLMTPQSQDQRFQFQQRNFNNQPHYNNHAVPYRHDDPMRHGGHPRMMPPHHDMYPGNPLNRGREFYPPDRQFPGRFDNFDSRQQRPQFPPFRDNPYPPGPHRPDHQNMLRNGPPHHPQGMQQQQPQQYNQPIPTTQQLKTSMAPGTTQGVPSNEVSNPPIHQYPPPDIEAQVDEHAPGTTPPPTGSTDQPPPPGMEGSAIQPVPTLT